MNFARLTCFSNFVVKCGIDNFGFIGGYFQFTHRISRCLLYVLWEESIGTSLSSLFVNSCEFTCVVGIFVTHIFIGK